MADFPEIPGYKVKKKLGQGGMATVYLGIPKNLKELVAIKILNPMVFNNPRLSKRFTKESKTLQKLNHPNIVAIHDVGVVQNCNYIVMEYFQGNLKEKIRNNGCIPPEEALHITAQIADALFYAHDKKIIHRDIKPDNIMFRKDGTPVLLDFGIAKHTDSNTKITRTGTSIGTPQYMSPEQCNAENLDGRSDIYSLGVVLFEMLTGRPPYRAKTTMGLVNQHIQLDVPLLPKKLQQFQPIIDKMMAKEKRKRIRSLNGLIHLIKELLNINTGRIKIDQDKFKRVSAGSKLRKGEKAALNATKTVSQIRAPQSNSQKRNANAPKTLTRYNNKKKPQSKKPSNTKKKGGFLGCFIVFLFIALLIYFLVPNHYWQNIMDTIKNFFTSFQVSK